MRLPFNAVRNVLSSSTERLRRVADEAFDRLQSLNANPRADEADHRDRATEDDGLDSTAPDETAGADGEVEIPEADSRPEAQPDDEAPKQPDGEPSDDTDGEQKRSETSEEAAETIGMLFDRIGGAPRSIRTLEPMADTDRSRRRRQSHRLLVTTGEQTEKNGDDGSDVTLDVSRLQLDELCLEVEDLDAHVALQAAIADLVNVDVGASVQLGEVELEIKGVEAEALLKVRLDEIRQLLSRALETVEQRPELITKALETAEETTEQIGDEVADQVDETAEEIDVSNPSIETKSRAEYDE